MKFLLHHKKFDAAERIQLIISYILQLIIIMAVIWELIHQQWLMAFATAAILALTLVPAILRRSYKVYIPVEFDLVTILFLFLSLFLGSIHDYYNYWWWDVVLHISSGFLLGVLGFLLVYVLNNEKKAQVRLKPLFVSLFAFAFAVMLGGVWEIFEFSVDEISGIGMQSGLVDTMWDLIVDMIGAVGIAVMGYFYTRKGDSLLFDRMIHRFVERNPQLFKRKG